ncbi:hypothetical protein DM01DRAFT_1362648 [Hesseltinella vesiculosa]|uniref:sn-1-specific diacylglycerol lipase n=1 Tax=Hesseltinella vesiculosa TaxID=101127 RepID=A0A1X2GKD1_9FUNG|nr:hypothetical protein DM01DRAFT_1362648 [Hesseltinella vesiculosa]
MGVNMIESTFTLAELFALSGLQFTSITIKTGLKACEESVRLVDGIFGATDTSRALASIITLVHRELMHDPEFQVAQLGRIAMLASLTKALTAFALLQTITHQQRFKQIQSTILWQGLVIEEETSQQALIQYQDTPRPLPAPSALPEQVDRTSVGESENQSMVLQQLQEILTNSSQDDDMSVILTTPHQDDDPNASYQMYEIITTTERTTIKTTRIRPVDPNRPDLPTKTKYVTLQSNEMDKESFLAIVDPSTTPSLQTPPLLPPTTNLALPANDDEPDQADSPAEDQDSFNVPGVWNKYAVQNPAAQTSSSPPPNVLLSAVSKKLSRKKMERKESYAWETHDGPATDEALPPVTPTRIMTSTSTTLRSTTSLVSNHHDDADDEEPDDHLDDLQPRRPPLQKSKSRWGLTMDAIRQKSNSISAAPLTKKKKKTAPANPRRNSSGSSGFPSMMTPLSLTSRGRGSASASSSGTTSPQHRHQHLQRSNSITSMASISRTTITTTYTTASASSPPPTPSNSTPFSHTSPASTTSARSSRSSSSSSAHAGRPLPMTPASASSPPSTPASHGHQPDAEQQAKKKARRIRFIRSMPLIRSSTPRSLEHEPALANFPRQHIISNIGHFMRYASAAYGESFMRVFGIGDMPTVLPDSHHHHPNHHAFAHHTGVMVQDILLSSYTDRPTLLAMHHPSIHALVHYVTVDHHTKSIVLTCRGTLGLSDVLTDLSFTYRDFALPTDPDRHFQAHDGMLDAAQLLAKEKGKVYQVVRDGLARFPDYGLVLCGHSLGGGVVSLLSVLWSVERHHFLEREPSAMVSSVMRHDPVPFVTSRQSGLPAGRPVHCYVYGPPCAMSLELAEYCGQGLVTSVVHGYDIVSCLSFGLVKDLKNVATSLHEETRTAEDIIRRIIARYNRQSASASRANNDPSSPASPLDPHPNAVNAEDLDDDQWFWATIKTMRADMRSEKLYPPMTVYHVESVPQLIKDPLHYSQAQAPNYATRQSKHRKAHMTTLTLIDDIQSRFSEINFSRSMFVDHTPLLYERAIRNLCRGYFGQDTAYETS